jgi:TDG/mug DNA glycosylase family protein
MRARRGAEVMTPRRPSREELLAARDKTVPDVIAPDLRVLFCGINPGLYTAAIGHHFGRPGNRFWPALHRSGFTDRQLDPAEERELLACGLGITNVVERATATADEVSAEELATGGRRLEAKVREYRPRWIAVLGIGAWRTAFGRPRAVLGRQEEPLGGASVWVLPNPSGLNAHYRLEGLAAMFHELLLAVRETAEETK